MDVAAKRGLFTKALEGYNRRDIRPMLETLHPRQSGIPSRPRSRATRPTTARRASGNGGRTSTPPSRSSRRASMSFETSAMPFWGSAAFRPVQERSPWTSDIGWLTRYRDGLAVWGALTKATPRPWKRPGWRSKSADRQRSGAPQPSASRTPPTPLPPSRDRRLVVGKGTNQASNWDAGGRSRAPAAPGRSAVGLQVTRRGAREVAHGSALKNGVSRPQTERPGRGDPGRLA